MSQDAGNGSGSVDTSPLIGPGHSMPEASKAAAELANEKLRAEIEKTFAEVAKLKVEVAAVPDDELAKQRLRADTEKTFAEAAKLRAEAVSATEAWTKLWRRPAGLAAILPGIAAVGVALYQIGNNYWETKTKEVKVEISQLDAQRNRLQGEVAKLEASKTKLEYEEERLKDQKEKFASEKTALENQLASLKSEKDKLNRAIEVGKLSIPLESAVNLSQQGGVDSDAAYSAVTRVLKENFSEEYRSLVEDIIRKAKPSVKARLYRSLYLVSYDKKYLDKLLDTFRGAPFNAENIEVWSVTHFIIGDHNESWPREDIRPLLFNALVDVLKRAINEKKGDHAAIISASIEMLCSSGCAQVSRDAMVSVATLARQALLYSRGDVVGWEDTLKIVYWFNPYAGKLLFVNEWLREENNIRNINQYVVGTFLRYVPAGTRVEYVDPKEPNSSEKSDWANWLRAHDKDLKIVLAKDALAWPAASLDAASTNSQK